MPASPRVRGRVRSGALTWVLAIALGLLTVDGFRRCAGELAPGPGEWGPGSRGALSASTRDLLASLEGPIEFTYFVTSEAELPSHLRHLPRTVASLLGSIEREFPDRMRWRIVDPDHLEGDDANDFGSSGIQTFGERTIQRDRWTSVRIHSSLEVAWGGHARVRIDGIAQAQGAVLETLLAEHLEAALNPRAPVVGVAGRGTAALERALSEDNEVLRVEFSEDESLPEALDVLWWVDPATVEPRHATALRRFLDAGGSVVLAAARFGGEMSGDVHRSTERSPGLAALAREFGLAVLPGFVIDPEPEVGALRWSECIAPNQDFRRFPGQPNGTLTFETPSAWTSDPQRLDDIGYGVDVLANGTVRAQRVVLPERPDPSFDPALLSTGIATPRAALALHLVPEDPWRGEMVVFGSPTPFLDDQLQRDDRAHVALVRVLQQRLASKARLVARRADFDRPTPLPDLAAGERIAWRSWVLGLPLLLGLGAWILQGRRASEGNPGGPPLDSIRGSVSAALVTVGVLLALALLGQVTGLLPGARWQLDLSRGGRNSMAPATEELARSIQGPVAVQVCTSSPLPVPWRRGWSEIQGRLDQLRGAGLELEVTHPHADPAEDRSRTELSRLGVHPLRLSEVGERSHSVREVYSSLRLSRGDRDVVLDFADPRTFEALELRLALALRELNGEPPPRIGFVGDAPRLSPAEAHLEYQSRGLFAPSGQDAFRLAREWIADHGFEVVPLDPESTWPEDLDALFWMQPRRDVEAPLGQVIAHLGRGRGALICAQHFEMQARFAQEDPNRPVAWPRPLYPDLESGALAQLGISLPRELLFDDAGVNLRRSRKSEVTSPGGEPEASSRPDQMRVAGRGPEGSPGRALGELVFETPSRIELDSARLSEQGLRASVWLTTGPAAWSRPWEGGELTARELEVDDAGNRAQDSAALAVDVRGRFGTEDSDTPSATEGRLLVVGSSSAFQNDALFALGAGHAQLLLDSASRLALGDRFAAISARRSSPAPLPNLGPTPRVLARIGALALGPLLVMLVGALLARRRGVRG